APQLAGILRNGRSILGDRNDPGRNPSMRGERLSLLRVPGMLQSSSRSAASRRNNRIRIIRGTPPDGGDGGCRSKEGLRAGPGGRAAIHTSVISHEIVIPSATMYCPVRGRSTAWVEPESIEPEEALEQRSGGVGEEVGPESSRAAAEEDLGLGELVQA